MIVETKVVGQPAELAERPVSLPAGETTLRDLLAALVRTEVDGYEERRRDRQLLRVLTPADLARGQDTGRYGVEARDLPPAPAYDDALARALEAFRDELYFVFVDGVQLTDLADPVVVGPDTRLRLVRLVALAGG